MVRITEEKQKHETINEKDEKLERLSISNIPSPITEKTVQKVPLPGLSPGKISITTELPLDLSRNPKTPTIISQNTSDII